MPAEMASSSFSSSSSLTQEEVAAGEKVMDEEELFRYTSTLASKEFGGRFPGTDGEKKALEFITSEAKRIGLSPGNEKENSYLQRVPLVRAMAQEVYPMKVESNDGSKEILEFESPKNFTAFSSKSKELLELLDSELVFIGYGIKASQWQWDDYANLDVKGKTVICLVNDPGFATKDPKLFNGNCMTYYGRWTYKFEEAGRQGAAGCLIVHNTAAASYPWHVIENGRGSTGKSYYLLEKVHHHSQCEIESWITEEVARKIFHRAGYDFDDLSKQAATRAFRPVHLNQRVSIRVKQDIEPLQSHNIVARIPGTDPTLSKEHIVFTAHWDHMGTSDGKIFCGARDNALGCAALLELGRAFLALPAEKRKRSIFFLFTTCEEQVLLGSLYYVANPLYPLRSTIACLNVDVMNTWGRTKDMSYSGKGFSDLDEYISRAAQRQKRTVKGEHTPETGMFYRSDHFPFAKNGVPAIYLKNGFEHIEKGFEWFNNLYREWVVECYHKPADVVVRDPTSKWCWDLGGCLEDTRLLFDVGCQLIDNDKQVHWKEEAEFREIRIAHLKEGKFTID